MNCERRSVCELSSLRQGFEEDDKPNFSGSYYSHCKAIAENLLQAYLGVLSLVACKAL